MDAGSVVRRFGVGAELGEWLEGASALPAVAGWTADAVASVGAARARELLAPLGLSGVDEAEAAALWAGEWPLEAAWIVERMAARVAADLGRSGEWVGWPSLSGVDEDRVRCAPLLAFAAAVGVFREYQARAGVPSDVVAVTLRDTGRQVAATRAMFGRLGLDTAAWVALVFRSGVFELGRLQFEPNVLGRQGAVRWLSEGEWESLGRVRELAVGAPALRVHIPAVGPLDAGGVRESLGRARAFFRSWSGVDHPVATCSSWLLDPQLGDYLPEGSNILGFQRMFDLVEAAAPGDADVFRFVSRMPRVDPARAPRATRLERAAAAHVESGRRWEVRTGWVRLP